MFVRMILFVLLIMLTFLSYGKKFYLAMNNGILSVITTGNIDFYNAISLDSNSITFNEQTLLQFTSSEPLSFNCNVLAEQLFNFLENIENPIINIYESGSVLEEQFFALNLGYITNEFYQQNQTVIIHSEIAVNEFDSELTSLLHSYDELPSSAVTDYPCMLGCGAYLAGSSRTGHYRTKKHLKQYKEIKKNVITVLYANSVASKLIAFKLLGAIYIGVQRQQIT